MMTYMENAMVAACAAPLIIAVLTKFILSISLLADYYH